MSASRYERPCGKRSRARCTQFGWRDLRSCGSGGAAPRHFRGAAAAGRNRLAGAKGGAVLPLLCRKKRGKKLKSIASAFDHVKPTFLSRSRHSHTSIARWALSSLHYRIATFALQRTFRFNPLGLLSAFFVLVHTHTAFYAPRLHCRPTPASFFIVFHSGIRKRKNVFQLTQYQTCQILVQTFPEPWARGSLSVFHFRKRQRFQVPGFEWVHELLLFCLASNPAQFCAEISCCKTELEHNFTLSESRMKNDFSVCRRGVTNLSVFYRRDGFRSASRLPACGRLHVRTHPQGTAPAAFRPCRQNWKTSLSFQALGKAVDVDSEVYYWRRSGVFWRMRASLGLACAQVSQQAATLCTQVVSQPRSLCSRLRIDSREYSILIHARAENPTKNFAQSCKHTYHHAFAVFRRGG